MYEREPEYDLLSSSDLVWNWCGRIWDIEKVDLSDIA